MNKIILISVMRKKTRTFLWKLRNFQYFLFNNFTISKKKEKIRKIRKIYNYILEIKMSLAKKVNGSKPKNSRTKVEMSRKDTFIDKMNDEKPSIIGNSYTFPFKFGEKVDGDMDLWEDDLSIVFNAIKYENDDGPMTLEKMFTIFTHNAFPDMGILPKGTRILQKENEFFPLLREIYAKTKAEESSDFVKKLSAFNLMANLLVYYVKMVRDIKKDENGKVFIFKSFSLFEAVSDVFKHFVKLYVDYKDRSMDDFVVCNEVLGVLNVKNFFKLLQNGKPIEIKDMIVILSKFGVPQLTRGVGINAFIHHIFTSKQFIKDDVLVKKACDELVKWRQEKIEGHLRNRRNNLKN